jgi:hypothetical protein
MDQDTDELEKVNHAVKTMWAEFSSEFAESDHTSSAYLVKWNYIHAYDQVWTNVALGMPLEGRVADSAVDAKTSARLLELTLERQSRVEGKIEQLVKGQQLLLILTSALFVTLVVSISMQQIAG